MSEHESVTRYYSFGFNHAHAINGFTYDKDVIVEITAPNPRAVMLRWFGTQWSVEYTEADLDLFVLPARREGDRMTAAFAVIAVFAALVAVWGFSLARISARADRAIELMNLPASPATDGADLARRARPPSPVAPQAAAAGDPLPLASGSPAPRSDDWRPLLDHMRAHDDEPRFHVHRQARVTRLQQNAARPDSHSGRAA